MKNIEETISTKITEFCNLLKETKRIIELNMDEFPRYYFRKEYFEIFEEVLYRKRNKVYVRTESFSDNEEKMYISMMKMKKSKNSYRL